MEKLKVVDEVWDIKKIILFLIVAVVIGFGIKTFVLDNKILIVPQNESSVKGVSIQDTGNSISNIAPSLGIKQGVEQKINDLKKEVNNINIVDIATSTPAVQKVLNDFKNLQNLPQTQAKQACVQICNGL